MAIGDLTAEQQVRFALKLAADTLLNLPVWTPASEHAVAEIREALKRMDEAGAA